MHCPYSDWSDHQSPNSHLCRPVVWYGRPPLVPANDPLCQHITQPVLLIIPSLTSLLDFIFSITCKWPRSLLQKKQQQHANARCPFVDPRQRLPFCLLANEVAYERMNIMELNEPDAKQQLIKTNDLSLGTVNCIINNDGIVFKVQRGITNPPTCHQREGDTRLDEGHLMKTEQVFFFNILIPNKKTDFCPVVASLHLKMLTHCPWCRCRLRFVRFSYQTVRENSTGRCQTLAAAPCSGWIYPPRGFEAQSAC